MLKKCEPLLSSMAIRASTDYGFRRSEEKALFINQMSDLYDAFKEGKTDKEIADMLSYDVQSSKIFVKK